MASVNLYTYDHFQPSGFHPGQQAVWTFGPWNWTKHAVVVTAHPFDASQSTRSIEVTHVTLDSYPGEPVGQKYVRATIRNNGPDPMYIYYIALVEIIS